MEKATFFELESGETLRSIRVLYGNGSVEIINPTIVEEIEAIRELLARHEDTVGWHHSGSASNRAEQCIERYKRIAEDAITTASKARDDMIAYLRGINFVAETCMAAHSHAEKAARLRGLMEVVEGRVEALREASFDYRNTSFRSHPDLMRWDGPERKLRERIRELEEELGQVNKSLKKPNEPGADKTDEDVLF